MRCIFFRFQIYPSGRAPPYPTTEFTPEYWGQILSQRLAERKQQEEQVRQAQAEAEAQAQAQAQAQDHADLIQTQLQEKTQSVSELETKLRTEQQERTREVSELQYKLTDATDKEKADQTVIKDQAGQLSDSQDKLRLLRDQNNQTQADLLKEISRSTDLEVKLIQAKAATTNYLLYNGLVFRNVKGGSTFWSNGVIQVSVPGCDPITYQPGEPCRVNRDLDTVHVYPLSDYATKVWESHS